VDLGTVGIQAAMISKARVLKKRIVIPLIMHKIAEGVNKREASPRARSSTTRLGYKKRIPQVRRSPLGQFYIWKGPAEGTLCCANRSASLASIARAPKEGAAAQ
jgi:hypothetical protein